MDTSKKYILMCDGAIEIQKIWVPDEKDFYFTKGSFPINHISKCKFLVTWLPRQDQLQRMVKERFKLRGVVDLYHFIKCFQIFQVKHTVGLDFTSMEQFWLAFVMKQRYSKQWLISEREWGK